MANMSVECKCDTCLSYMFEWDPPLSSSTHGTCYKFHVQIRSYGCYLPPSSNLKNIIEQCQESQVLQIILKNLFVTPLFKLTPRQAQIPFSLFIHKFISFFYNHIHCYLYRVSNDFNVSVNGGLPMKVDYRRTCLNLSIHNCKFVI